MLWFAAAFGLAGCLLLLATARRPLVLFMGSIVFVCIIFSSSSFVNLFGVEFAKWAGKHMTFNRLLMLIKPFWYGAAGFLLVTAARGIGQFVRRGAEQRDAGWGRVRQWISAAGMALFVSGFVLPVLYYTLAVFVRNEVLRPTQWHSERPDLAARDAFVAWAKAQSRDESQFFRIAYGFEADEHTLAVLNKDIPFPMYKVWNTPTGHFKYNVDSSTNQALRAVNVRYALTERPISRPDFNLERTFDGRLRLYSFKDWDPNPFVVNGGGKVRLVSLRDERIVLRAEPGASGSLRLNVSYFPKWRATRDGVPVPITAVPAAGVEKSAFMQVPLAPGIYEFRYRRGFSDYIGTLLGLVGLAACLGLSNPERSRNIAVGAVKRLHQFIGQIARRSRSA
jgi:hypothetical protein